MAKNRKPMVHSAQSVLKSVCAKRSLLVFATVLGILAIFALSCESTRSARKKEEDVLNDLIKAATDFNNMIKWQNYDGASMLVSKDLRDAFLLSVDRIEGRVNVEEIQVAYCEVADKEQDTEADDEDREGKVTLKLVNLTVLPSNRVTTKRYIQHWEYRDGAWFVKADLEEMFR